MDPDLDPEQAAILETAQAFGRAEIAPHARAWERAGTIPRDLWPRLGALGFGGLAVPEAQGGAGLTRADGTLVYQGLAAACPSVAAFLSIHNMGTAMVAGLARPTVRDRLLPRLLSMQALIAYCLTEPGAGSDAAALTTRAKRLPGGGWRLTGAKAFISGGGYADAYIVMARSGGPGAAGISAFLVEAGAAGLSFGALEDKMGWRAQETRMVHLDGVEVGDEALIGAEGQGFAAALAALDGGRLNIAACSLGAAEAAVAATCTHVRNRRAFGGRLADLQAVRFRLAGAAAGLEASRLMLRAAAVRLDRGEAGATAASAMAKAFVTETCHGIVDDCLQLHGGYGYLADTGIEKLARDLRVHRILEGATEVMHLIVARRLLDGPP